MLLIVCTPPALQTAYALALALALALQDPAHSLMDGPASSLDSSADVDVLPAFLGLECAVSGLCLTSYSTNPSCVFGLHGAGAAMRGPHRTCGIAQGCPCVSCLDAW